VKILTGESRSIQHKCFSPLVKFSGLKVLLTEDNTINQKIAERMLKSLGCEVNIASDGLQAVEKVKNGNIFDVIFMDLHMPGMDGIAATSKIIEIQKQNSNQKAYVVALTAKISPEGRESCLLAGMKDYIIKPVTQQKLVTILSRLFPEKKKHNSKEKL